MAGLSLAVSVDIAALPPDTAAAVREALRRVDVAALSRRPPEPPPGPDRFQYDLTVTSGGQRHSLSLQEPEVPAELRPLIKALLPLARPQP